MRRDPFGLTRLYYEPSGRGHARSVRALLQALPDLPRELDLVAVSAHLAGETATERSFLAAVRAVPPGCALAQTGAGLDAEPYAITPRAGDLRALLRTAIERTLRDAPGPVGVALSGGLDSAIVLALVRELDPSVRVLTLAPTLEGYGELDATRASARSLGLGGGSPAGSAFAPVRGGDLEVVSVGAEDFRGALQDAITAMEVPLYNLHPVGKLLLARAARARGLRTVLSGDGADHVLRRDVSADYLPLVGAAFDAEGVALQTPFLDERVIAHCLASPPDPDKRELRALGARLPIPEALWRDRKVSRLTPPIDLAGLVPLHRLETLAAALGRALPSALRGPDLTALDGAAPSPALDRERVRWVTLALLADAFERWP